MPLFTRKESYQPYEFKSADIAIEVTGVELYDQMIINFNAKVERSVVDLRDSEALQEMDPQVREEAVALYKQELLTLRDSIPAYVPDQSRRASDIVNISVIQILARASLALDNLHDKKSNDENTKQLLLKARDLNNLATNMNRVVAISSFLTAIIVVSSLVFAIPTGGMSLMFLLCAIPTGTAAYLSFSDASTASSNASVANNVATFFASRKTPSDATTVLDDNKKTEEQLTNSTNKFNG